MNLLDNNTQKLPVTKPAFHLNDVQSILEALGILPNADVMELTCQYYFNDKHNRIHSLLTCLFKAIVTLRNNHGYVNYYSIIDIVKCVIFNVPS